MNSNSSLGAGTSPLGKLPSLVRILALASSRSLAAVFPASSLAAAFSAVLAASFLPADFANDVTIATSEMANNVLITPGRYSPFWKLSMAARALPHIGIQLSQEPGC